MDNNEKTKKDDADDNGQMDVTQSMEEEKGSLENQKVSSNDTEADNEEQFNLEKQQDNLQESDGKNKSEENKSEENKSKFNLKKEILSWVLLAVIAYTCATLITNVVIIKSIIPTNSMEDTVMIDDKIVGNRLAYLFSSPERGDIVIFKFPDDESQYFLKRVIGLPGETLEIRDGGVYIYNASGELIEDPLDEPYLKEEMITDQELTFTVPEGSYFMMGDNRNVSHDSRYWSNTFVKEDKILAKAWFRYSPNFDFLND